LIYICIPAHNEEQTVGVVLWKIRQVMAEFPRDYQILVADDASTDKTSEVLSPYARVLPLTVVRSDKRRGYAASLEMLLREAVRRSEYPKRDVIVTLQADFSQEPEDIVPIIKAMEAGADIVCGESTLPPDTGWKLRWSRGMAARQLSNKSLQQGVKDPYTGFRAYRVFTVKKAMEERGGGRLLLHDSWAANAELLAATAVHARRVEPLDVTVRPHRLQRPSRLHPWPALKNVWAYARRAKPEIETASVSELEESLASVTTSRRNDAASVRERMSERSDMHGNRSPHGDRQPHNARTEPRRGERQGRNRNDTQGNRERGTSNARGQNGQGRTRNESSRGQTPRNESSRSEQQRADSKRNEPQRADSQRSERTRTERPRKERTQENAPRTRSRNGDRNRARNERAQTEATAADQPELLLTEADVVNDASADLTAQNGEVTKRRRRRGRRSRGGKRENNGAEGDVGAVDSETVTADGMQDEANDVSAEDTGSENAPAKKRRRGRRGGRGRRRQTGAAAGDSGAGESGAGESGAGDSGAGDSGAGESAAADAGASGVSDRAGDNETRMHRTEPRTSHDVLPVAAHEPVRDGTSGGENVA
jgi:hypothetical protein